MDLQPGSFDCSCSPAWYTVGDTLIRILGTNVNQGWKSALQNHVCHNSIMYSAGIMTRYGRGSVQKLAIFLKQHRY